MTVTTAQYTDRAKTMVLVNGKEHGPYPGHHGNFFNRIQLWIDAGNTIAEPDLVAIRKEEIADEYRLLIDSVVGNDMNEVHFQQTEALRLDNKGQGALNASEQAKIAQYQAIADWVIAAHTERDTRIAECDTAPDPDDVIPTWPAAPA